MDRHQKGSITVSRTFMLDFLLGGLAATVSKSVSAPMERMKLILQVETELLQSGIIKERYHGVIDCLTKTYRTEGVLSLWKGNISNVLRYFPTQALNFAFRDQFKKLNPYKEKDAYWKRFASNVISGSIAGATSLLIVYPLDMARTLLASDVKNSSGKQKYKGMRDVFKKAVMEDGAKGLYRGFVVSCVTVMVYRGGYFGIYDSVCPLVPAAYQGHFAVSFFIGWASTLTAGLFCYPLDTVRRRMMYDGVHYHSSIDCIRSIIKNEGVKYFYKGAAVNIFRALAGAGALAGYDRLQLILFGKRYSAGSSS